MNRRPAHPVALLVGVQETVPLRERIRLTQYLRVAAVLFVVALAVVAPGTLAPGRGEVLVGTLVYAVGVLAAGLVGRLRLRSSQALTLFIGMLAADGLWLAWTSQVSGGLGSPLRYLVLLHVCAVVLLASARAGLLLALWHSLLLVTSYAAERTGALEPSTPDAAGGTPAQQLAVFVVVLWLVAVSTSVLSAVNQRELRRGRHDLEALTAFAEQVERAGDSKDVARLLLDSLVETFRPVRGVVLAGPDGQLALLAAHGLAEGTLRRPGRPGRSAVVAAAQEQQATQVVPGLDADAEPWVGRLLPDAGEVVVVPLVADGKPLGAVVLEQPPGSKPISRRGLTALERSASYAALSLRNAWLLEQVQRLAATDGLTKIANRRTFESTLEREVARASRSAEQVSLVMVDIDHFKSLNDTHGHQAGDEVLRNVAAALSCECRDFDTPARYGGEEFAVVLPGCGPDEAGAIAERLRKAVAAAPSVVPITASAGVASYPSHAGDADTLVRAADDALYRSKRAGRNRTTRSEGVPAEAQVDALLRRAVSQRLGRSEPTAAPIAGD